MMQWFHDGGAVMWILLGISLLSWGVILERAYILFREARLTRRLRKLMDDVGYSPEDIRVVVPQHPCVLGLVLQTVYDYRGLRREDNMLLVRARLNEEMGHLERGLTLLEVTAGVAPLLGLLGTVLGMVEIFSVIAVLGVGDPAVLSGGISKALNTTVFGLITAIPALTAFSFFDRKIEAMIRSIEKGTTLAFSEVYVGTAAEKAT